MPSFRAIDKFEDTDRPDQAGGAHAASWMSSATTGLDQLVDVEELEPGEERVALVDVGVADVHVAIGGELRLHLVEVVLAADELGLDAVA